MERYMERHVSPRTVPTLPIAHPPHHLLGYPWKASFPIEMEASLLQSNPKAAVALDKVHTPSQGQKRLTQGEVVPQVYSRSIAR